MAAARRQTGREEVTDEWETGGVVVAGGSHGSAADLLTDAASASAGVDSRPQIGPTTRDCSSPDDETGFIVLQPPASTFLYQLFSV